MVRVIRLPGGTATPEAVIQPQPGPPAPAYFAPSISGLWGAHAGETVCVVGTGTSLAGFDYSRLSGRITIALNDAVRAFVPTYHLFSDPLLHQRYVGHEYSPETIIVSQNSECHALRLAEFGRMRQVMMFVRSGDDPERTGEDDDLLYVAHTVATGGIHMAWKLGAATIILLGVDGFKRAGMYYADGRPTGDGGEYETTDGGDGRLVETRHRDWNDELNQLGRYLAGRRRVPVIWNCSTESTIDAWPRIPLEEALRRCP